MNHHNHHHLRHTITTLQTITTLYNTWHKQINQLLADGYPTGIDYNATSRGGISDPVGHAAIQRHKHSTDIEQSNRLIRQLHQLADELYTLINKTPTPIDIKQIVRSARCSGAIDPTCTNLADGRRQRTGLCDRCWQIQYRQQRAEQQHQRAS